MLHNPVGTTLSYVVGDLSYIVGEDSKIYVETSAEAQKK